MKRASAIVTNRGGRTCHAAIIARELGVPAVVGTGNALETIPNGKEVTVSCAEGDTGYIYEGTLPFERTTTDLGNMPPAPLKIMMNVANPDRAFDFGMLPNAGIGLAGLEGRKLVVSGQGGPVRVKPGGRRYNQKKKRK